MGLLGVVLRYRQARLDSMMEEEIMIQRDLAELVDGLD